MFRIRARRAALLAALAILPFAPPRAEARGGGGCLEEGSLVETPGGAVPVERLSPGDEVLASSGGRLVRSRVAACFEVHPAETIEISAGGRVLRLTSEHPVAAEAPGLFRMAAALRPGDRVLVAVGARLAPAPVLSVRRVKATRPAYNLLVSPGGTFVANGFLVHNKGCFLPDAPILKSDGTQVPIRDVRAGDLLLASDSGGKVTAAKVLEVLVHEVDEYCVVRTRAATLKVTEEHPFFVGGGAFKTLGLLKPGDSVFVFDGLGLRAEPILGIERVRARTAVYNLRTDAPNTFFAWGVLVHNKGGGCLEAGTLVGTPAGSAPVERLRPGDEVMASRAGGVEPSRVLGCFEVHPSEYLEISAGGRVVRVTAEHPLAVAAGDGSAPASGDFRTASSIRAGDRLLVSAAGRLAPAPVLSVRRVKASRPAYNLLVSPGGTYFANGLLVHNKGCFLPDAPILKSDGTQVPIRDVRAGDLLLASDSGGKVTAAKVLEVLVHEVDEYCVVRTRAATLKVTEEHPFFVGGGAFKMLERLKAGDSVFVFDGLGLRPEPILGIERVRARTTVYNLRTDAPNTFFAWGVLVHNKGGFGGGGRSWGGRGGGGGGDPQVALIVIGCVVGFIILVNLVNRRAEADEDLDFCHGRSAIEKKAGKTRRLVDFVAKQDPTFRHETLVGTARATFTKLQECWEKREYGPMEPLLMPDLYRQHLAQIRGMIRNHEINVIAGLHVEAVDVVNVRYTEKQDLREFTALITARATDHYVDDRTKKWLRGDEGPARFQEFWTFQQQDGRWLLREIEQTRESDALKDENFFEPFTEQGLRDIYGETLAQGPAGPWLSKAEETKDTKIERLLGFLVQTDRMWDRRAMLERARQVFLRVYLAYEAGDDCGVPADDLFPDVASRFLERIRDRRSKGVTVSYRNLCVRKVELVLVRNCNDNANDEYVVRIRAHAQRSFSQNGKEMSRQEYVSPFTEYWTFGRLGGAWKLKGILPEAGGEAAAAQENVDEGSSGQMLEWFYNHSRPA